MTVAGIAHCGYCGDAFLARDETTTESIEGYLVVVEADECPHCATPTSNPGTFVLEDAPIAAAGGAQ